ncbi:MAG: hypothetical protein E7L19_13305, partial [Acinetobacter baumannii]|nr:hypothetical protein [Acinetobacter baumannii]
IFMNTTILFIVNAESSIVLLQATRPILIKESAKNLYITILPILLVKRLINNIKKTGINIV